MTDPDPPLTLFVPGIPAPQGSKRAFRRGSRTILVESSRHLPAWRQAIATAARAVMPAPIDARTPVAVELEFVMPRTKAMRSRPAPPMGQRPDADKLARAALDGLTGPVLTDDAQVVRLTAIKRRAAPGEAPGMRATIAVDATKPPAPTRVAGEGS